MKPAQIISYDDTTIRDRIEHQQRAPVGKIAEENAKIARERVRALCSHAFPNINDYRYVFFTAGATEAIDFLVTKQPTSAAKNEYRYVFAHSTVAVTDEPRTRYLSYPFSGTGNREDIPTDVPVILDASYIFCVDQPLSPPLPKNVQHVIFSLSKSHNLYDYRCGWFFTNTRFPGLYTLQYEYGYMSSTTQACVAAAAQFAPNVLRQRHAESISASYAKAGLSEGEVNLFGFTPAGERVPYYQVEQA